MRRTMSWLTVERAAASVVALLGAVSAAVLLAGDTRAAGAPAWLLPALAGLGAGVPLCIVLVARRASHRAALVAFPSATACHAAALGAGGVGPLPTILLGMSIGVSVLVCVWVTLLRAEASENRPRNRF